MITEPGAVPASEGACHRSMRALCLLALALAATAIAAASPAIAAPPRRLAAAMTRTVRDDRALVGAARSAQRCLLATHRRPGACRPELAALQYAGSRLSRARAALAFDARSGAVAHSSRLYADRLPPALAVSGRRLSWSRVSKVNWYVLMSQPQGAAATYSLVRGESATPAAVSGTAVTYSVRTATRFSSWSSRRTISYPTSEPAPAPAAAPSITVSGQTLSWTPTPGVSVYVFVEKVPGRSDRYSTVNGTSLTPQAVPGQTVRYSVRTAVEGSAWAGEVSIAWPAAPAEAQETAPRPVEAPEAAAFQPGMNAGWVYPGQLDVPAVTLLGAKLVRVEFPIEWTAAQLLPTIAGYAEKGVRVAPLATFDGRLPSPAEAQNLASWARAYGPGGTFWATRSDGSLAIRTIEFGNETSAGYQYGDGAGQPSYTARAQTYALRLKEASEAISSAGQKVGLLAVAEDWTGDWMNGMFSAVPNLGSYVAGWVSHPYGTEWRSKLQNIISQTAAHGASSSIPIDVTEWGLASDNGRCLSENYGWNACMTYQEAAATMHRVVAEMRTLVGSRMGMFILYQVRDQRPTGASGEREAYFGLLQHENQEKGPYTAAARELLAS